MADGQADSAAPAAGGGGNTKTPSDFLKSIKGKPVVVKLNSGVDYRGVSGGRARLRRGDVQYEQQASSSSDVHLCQQIHTS